jgi:hypothetical protein
MATRVRFAFGSEPVIGGIDAIELAGLLERIPVTAAFSIASKIRYEALHPTVSRGRHRKLSLDRNELSVLLTVLDDSPASHEDDAFGPLHDELRAEITRRDPRALAGKPRGVDTPRRPHWEAWTHWRKARSARAGGRSLTSPRAT